MTRSIPILLAVPLAWLAVCSAHAQRAAPPAGTAGPPVRVQGRVLEADTSSTPVPRARITVTPRGGTPSVPVFADGSGRFEISVPSSAPYTVSLAKAGFVPQTFTRTATASAATIELRLVRGGVIAGQVMDGGGQPVVGGGVRARRLDAPSNTPAPLAYTDTDDRGAYRLSGLAPGRYEVAAVRAINAMPALPPNAPVNPAFVDALARQRDASLARGTPLSGAAIVEVRGGEEQTVWLVSSEPVSTEPDAAGGTVSGTVRDAFGEPVDGLDVQLWKVGFFISRLTANRALSRTTDDRGRYRVFHVPPGRYLVVATGDPLRGAASAGTSLVPVYYPGRHAIADATLLQVGPGEELSSVDIRFTERAGSRVSGLVTNAAGQPAAARVTLTVSHRSGAVALPPLQATANARGEFELRQVPPGDYVVHASTLPRVVGQRTTILPPAETPGRAAAQQGTAFASMPVYADDPREYAAQYVMVDTGTPSPLFLQTAQTVEVRGRVLFEEGAPPDRPVRVAAFAADPDLEPAPGLVGRRAAAADADGTFAMQDLLGPMYVTLVNAPPGWWLRTATAGRAIVTDQPIDFGSNPGPPDAITLVLANTAAALQGRALTERGALAGDTWAIVFPSDSRRWYYGSPYVRNTHVRANGRFVFESLPPGDYWVAVVDTLEDDSPSGEWQSADVLSRLIPLARRVSLPERERVTMDLRLARMPRF